MTKRNHNRNDGFERSLSHFIYMYAYHLKVLTFVDTIMNAALLKVYGLNFSSKDDADVFATAMLKALEVNFILQNGSTKICQTYLFAYT